MWVCGCVSVCVCKGWIKSSSLELLKIYWIYFFDFMILHRCISVEIILCIILYSLEQAWTWVTQTTASFQKYVQGLWTATANKSGGKWSSDLDLGQSKGSCSTSWSITVQFYVIEEFLMGEIWNHINIFLPSTAKFLLESHNVDVVLKPYYFIHYIFTQLILWWTFKVFKWNFQRFDCMFNDCLPCQSLNSIARS